MFQKVKIFLEDETCWAVLFYKRNMFGVVEIFDIPYPYCSIIDLYSMKVVSGTYRLSSDMAINRVRDWDGFILPKDIRL